MTDFYAFPPYHTKISHNFVNLKEFIKVLLVMILPREMKKCELYNCLYIASTGIKKKKKAGHQGFLAITRASKVYLIN